MDSFEINKIVAAVLMVALLVIGIGKLSDVIFHVEKPETPGYAVDVEEATTVSSSTKASVEEKIDIDALNMDDCIGFDQKDFIEKCINLANSPEKLEYYKYNLRENLLNSPLTNSINFTRKIEKEYDKMWLNLKK